MAYALIQDGEPVELAPGRSFRIGDIQYPANMLGKPDKMAALGAVVIVEPDPAPEGQRIASTALEVDGDAVLRVATYEAIDLTDLKQQAIAEVSNRRWERTQTFTYDGVVTQADPAISAVTAAVVASQFMPPETIRTWKLADGEFRQWDLQAIIAFGMAISAHVQLCFDREAELSDLIEEADTFAELNAIDRTTGWPG